MREHDQPAPISTSEQRKRTRRAMDLGSALGFVGSVEYVHVYSQSGGAQYCVGPSPDDDIIIVYAEAFERDADPDDFKLDALIAHECGHQKLTRNANLRRVVAKLPGEQIEEVLASIIGSVLLGETESGKALLFKATVELGDMGIASETVVGFIERLQRLVRSFL